GVVGRGSLLGIPLPPGQPGAGRGPPVVGGAAVAAAQEPLELGPEALGDVGQPAVLVLPDVAHLVDQGLKAVLGELQGVADEVAPVRAQVDGVAQRLGGAGGQQAVAGDGDLGVVDAVLEDLLGVGDLGGGEGPLAGGGGVADEGPADQPDQA